MNYQLFAAVLLMPLAALDAAEMPAKPFVFWSAEPVLPGETAMLQGAGFGKDAKIELTPLGSAEKAAPVAVLDANQRSLRYVVPKDWTAGAYRCRVETQAAAVTQVLNAPQPWWFQADDGRRATPGGWVRVCGRCLALDPAKAAIELRRDGQAWPLRVREATLWSLDAAVPADLPTGSYEIWTHNGTGGEAGWIRADALTVATPSTPWKNELFGVTDFGAAPDDEADDSPALTRALETAARSDGGIVRFPRGRFRLTGKFTLPPRVLLQGPRMELTHLVWADTPPESFFTSTTGGLGIEDLSLYASNYHMGLSVKAPPGAASVRDVRIRRVRVRFTPLSVKELRGDVLQRRLDAQAQMTWDPSKDWHAVWTTITSVASARPPLRSMPIGPCWENRATARWTSIPAKQRL